MRGHVSETAVGSVSNPPADVFVLDVREPDEWAAGHIDVAHHIPMMEVPSRLTELPDGERVLVVCRSGHRSAHVAAFLEQQGTDAVNLIGGMHAWEAAGRPMVSETGEPPAVI